jgi:hypothetical protein
VKPTKPLTLVTTLVVAIVVAYAVFRIWDHADPGGVPSVPISAPITLAVLAAAVFGVALGLRSRFNAYREARKRIETGARVPQDRPVKPIDPLQAARALVLAKASGLVGAVFGGIYGGYALFVLGRLEIVAYHSQVLPSWLAFGAGVALLAAALFLERILKVPPDQHVDGQVPSGTSGA